MVEEQIKRVSTEKADRKDRPVISNVVNLCRARTEIDQYGRERSLRCATRGYNWCHT